MPTPIYRSQLSRPLSCNEIDSNIDAVLDRSNHTGTQLAATIVDFSNAVAQVTLIQTLQQCCTDLTAQILQLQNDIFGAGQLNTILNTYTQALQNSINTLSTNLTQLQNNLNVTNTNLTTLTQNYNTLNTFANTLNSRLNALRTPSATIFVDSVNGSDTNSGFTSNSPVQTLAKASELSGFKVATVGGLVIKLANGTYDGATFYGKVTGQTGPKDSLGNYSHLIYIIGNTSDPSQVIINHRFDANKVFTFEDQQGLSAAQGLHFLNNYAFIQGITFQYNPAKLPAGTQLGSAVTIHSGLGSWVYVDKCVFKALPMTGPPINQDFLINRIYTQLSQPGGLTYGVHLVSADWSYIKLKDVTIDGNSTSGFHSVFFALSVNYSNISFDDSTITLTNTPRFWVFFNIDSYSSLSVDWRRPLGRYTLRFVGDFGVKTGQQTVHSLQGGSSVAIPTTEVNRTIGNAANFNLIRFPSENATYGIWPSSAANVTKASLWPSNMSTSITGGYYLYTDTRPDAITVNTVVSV